MSPVGSRLLFTAPVRKAGKDILTDRGSAAMKSVAVTFAADARPAVDAVTEETWGGGLGWLLGGAERKPSGVMVVSGRHTAATIERAKLPQGVVLYVPPAGIDSAAQQRLIEQLRRSSSVVILSGDDSATFARRRHAATPPVVIDEYIAGAMGVQRWAAYVRADALEYFWRVAGVDLARARADTTPVVRPVSALAATLEVQPENVGNNGPNGVNVVGVLPGADPQLGNEYVVFSAHMDNGGGDDRATNGAQDDNTAGISGLIALAKAFSQPGARPRRSLVFLATSGAANGSPGLGANFFAQWPTVKPLVLSVTLDAIGVGARDSIVVDGLSDADFATRPDWVAAKHSELGLTVVDGGTISDPALEHFAFVRRAVPGLFIHGGAQGDPPAVDPPAVVDTARAARIMRLVYYVGQELANAPQRPMWNAMGRRYRLSALER